MLVGWMDPNVHNFGTDVNFSLAAITFTLQGENGDVPLVISGNDERLPNINAGGHGTKGQCVLDNLVDFVVDHEMFVFSGVTVRLLLLSLSLPPLAIQVIP